MPHTNLLLFLIATVTLNVTPGPDMLYVIARSVGQGRAAGIASAFGVAGGCLVHTLAVALGLASLMMAVPMAYQVVKYAGAAYLVFLGIRTLTGPRQRAADAPLREDTLTAIFLQGVVTNVLNPKVALFFVAFLPQFVDAHLGHVALQVIFLGVLFNTSGTIVNVAVALAASYSGGRIRVRVGNSSFFRWVTGSVFIGLGARLAFLERR
ncbi:MAG: LysE family translocator [candidate division NC10 bacterium]|nr:LysE family translocator [candidate division NC10 bacterium]